MNDGESWGFLQIKIDRSVLSAVAVVARAADFFDSLSVVL